MAFVAAGQVSQWLADETRTTYLLDVGRRRSSRQTGAPAFAHAPGGQLVQTTDHWIGTRGARIVLLDDEQVRAPMTAQWLRQLGHEAYVLEGGVAAAKKIETPRAPGWRNPPGPGQIAAGELGRSWATEACWSSTCGRA